MVWAELISITPNPEYLVEYAYRLCYGSEVKGGEEGRKFIAAKVKLGHESPLEHASATFLLKGSRAFSHQLVRHRIASYSQQSQRYVKENNFKWVLPPTIQSNQAAYDKFVSAMHDTRIAYEQLVADGIPKEDARYVLPNACETKVLMSANFREWRHFIELRADRHAQWEIREVAELVLRQLNDLAPSVFGDLYAKFIGEPKGEVINEGSNP